MNRWDRRTNLHQTTFVNCIAYNPIWAEFKKDNDGNIIGSEGFFQDKLFYITDQLNLTIQIIESPFAAELLENGQE